MSARQEEGAFSDARVREFHLGLAKSFASNGWLNLAFLSLDGEPVAAKYGFIYGNKFYSYLSGFAPDYSKYRVGSVINMYLLRAMIDRGLKEFDFLNGEEPYKTRWNTRVRRVVGFRARKSNFLFRLTGSIHGKARFLNRVRGSRTPGELDL